MTLADMTTPGTGVAVRFADLTVTLGGVSILDGVGAEVPAGGCTAIVGPNGAGKTTLLLAFLGEIEYQGRIHVAPGRGGRPARLGYVPQRLQFDRYMPLTVTEFLAMGPQRSPLWLGLRKVQRQRAAALLESVRAGHLATRRLGALSGGELQRVLLALALQQDPDLLLLDEPAAGVDIRGGQVLCELLESLRAERRFTQIMVSHDLAVVTAHATHVICLNRRVLAEGAPRTVLTPETLLATFGLHRGVPDARAMPPAAGCTAGCCRREADDA